MQSTFLHRLNTILWGLAVTLIVLLAVYVSVGRLLASNLQAYQEEVLNELNSRLPFTLQAKQLSGEWHSFTPQIVLSELRLGLPDTSAPLELAGGRIGLDVLDSIRTRSLQFTALQLSQLNLKGQLTADGRLQISGLSGEGGSLGEWLQEFLLNIEKLVLEGNTLQLVLPGGEVRNLELNLRLSREGSYRYLDANLVSNAGTTIKVLGEGVGNPFTPDVFSGELYLDINSTDLGASRDLIAGGKPAVWAEGELGLEVWGGWKHGKARLETRVEARDIVVSPHEGQWTIPLDLLAFDASLVQSRNRRTLFTQNIFLQQGEKELSLPRLQVDLWGESLRLRAAQLSLRPFNDLLVGMEQLPAKLIDVFKVLQPQGNVSSLQLNIGDFAQPTLDWSVEANFDQVQVQSWRGAPGVTSGSGYMELSPGDGYVVLDSQQLSMEFPTIFDEALNFADIHGTLNIAWDAQDLVLSSGLITAQAQEGAAQVLFGLNIPLAPTEVGLEMDLMVGLENSHPKYRDKYIPFILNKSLRDWLAGSVGEGDLQQTGFIWRGSLRRGATPLRTVQLFLNIQDTELDYHPDWPAIQGIDGVVLISDTDVSVWAEQARLYDSHVEQLSAEAWMNDSRQIMLAIDARMSGDATDGLRVINESLLGPLAGNAFANWEANGGLETRLGLVLNLADKTIPPEVDVQTRWQNVALAVQPGNLAVDSVNGLLSYRSQTGFSSRDLVASLWGEPLSVLVGQSPIKGEVFDIKRSTVTVDLAAAVDASDVRQWLNIDSLRFATGVSQVSGQVRIPPGEIPLLQLDSELQGVQLDLPAPWTKVAQDTRELQVFMPLGGEDKLLRLRLGDDLALKLDLEEGRLGGATLGVEIAAPVVEQGQLRVVGHAPVVDADAWFSFIEEYFLTSPGEDVSAAESGEGPVEADLPFVVSLEDMRADHLLIWGRDVPDVQFNLQFSNGDWQISGETDWLQGELFLPGGDEAGRLALSRFDTSGLDYLKSPDVIQDANVEQELAIAGEPALAPEPLTLPDLDVSVASLSKGGQSLGDFVFNLRSQGTTLIATGITGNLAGMKVGVDDPARLTWRQQLPQEASLDATLNFKDLGETLELLGYDEILETEKGSIDLALQWPGTPQGFTLASVSGSLLIDTDEGRFLETPQGTAAPLRVVSILNLADVVRRLSLSQMFESGVPFENIEGEVYLHGGTIEVAAIDIRGSASSFSFHGLSDVVSQSLDGELVATLPVANNLPWVAALAAGLPVAAGVFVVSKVFEKQVNRLTSGVYSIAGTWEEPEVNFDRIFDDSARLKVYPLDPNNPGPQGQRTITAQDPQQPTQPPASSGL